MWLENNIEGLWHKVTTQANAEQQLQIARGEAFKYYLISTNANRKSQQNRIVSNQQTLRIATFSEVKIDDYVSIQNPFNKQSALIKCRVVSAEHRADSFNPNRFIIYLDVIFNGGY